MIAKPVIRGMLLTFLAGFVLCSGLLNASQIFAAYMSQPSIKRTFIPPLAFFSPEKHPTSFSEHSLPLQLSSRRVGEKRLFLPGKIVGKFFEIPDIHKEPPVHSRSLNRLKDLPKDFRQKTQTGIILEAEAAYGPHYTFIGQFQHGTQFKGAHYYLQGHWETTEGEGGNQEEERIRGRVNVDWDLSRQSKLSLDSAYYQSSLALPELQHLHPHHKKSAIEIIAGLQWNFEADTNVILALSGELARFEDQENRLFEMNRYDAHLALKHLWDPQNTLLLDAVGSWEMLDQDDAHVMTHYSYAGTLLNSFAMHDSFAIEAGVEFDYYSSEEDAFSEYLIAPVFTTRFRLLRHTNLYTTYHPRLVLPDFTELYIKQLYTVVNPELRPEKMRHYLESGIHQRFGDAVSLNIGLFYRESESVRLQIDENRDNLLEYLQPGSVRFIGVKANLQMNFLEQLVQSITYTYTTYKILNWNQNLFSQQLFETDALTYQPNHQVQASVYWTLPFGLSVDFHGMYLSEQYRNADPQYRIGKRFFLNIALTQKITDELQLYLIGRNLTDTNTYDIIPILDSDEITSSRLFFGGIRFRF